MGNRITMEEKHHPTATIFFLASMGEEDLKHLILLARDPDLIDLMGWSPFFETDETEQFIEAISCCALPYSRKNPPLVLGVYVNLEDFPIGYVVLKGMNTDLQTAEIGMAILGKKYRMQGYGRSVLQRAVGYAFEELHIQTVGAAVLASNRGSVNMCKKAGFLVREMMRNSWSMPNGDLVDMLWMEKYSD